MAFCLANWTALRIANPMGFWILDTDGWCYWSELLNPDTATSLLLDNVTLIDESNKPGDNYAYFIDVRLQACNRYEVDDLIARVDGDITEQGEAIIRWIAESTPISASDALLAAYLYEKIPILYRLRELIVQAAGSSLPSDYINIYDNIFVIENLFPQLYDILDRMEADGFGPYPALRSDYEQLEADISNWLLMTNPESLPIDELEAIFTVPIQLIDAVVNWLLSLGFII